MEHYIRSKEDKEVKILLYGLVIYKTNINDKSTLLNQK